MGLPMVMKTRTALEQLYEADETAWLDQMAELVDARQLADLDLEHLAEYLYDMARRDRKAVFNRLVVLLTHLLKWRFQPGKRSESWRKTILTQRRHLNYDLRSGSLKKHMEGTLAEAYDEAIQQAVTATDLPEATFPRDCPWPLAAALAGPLDP